MKHRLNSIDNLLRGLLFGSIFAVIVTVLVLVALANTGNAALRTVRAGDPGYTPTASEAAVIPQPVRTDIPPGMLPVPVETEQASATRQAEFAPYATQTAIATFTMQAEFAPYASQTALVVNQLTATTLPQTDTPPTGEPFPQP